MLFLITSVPKLSAFNPKTRPVEIDRSTAVVNEREITLHILKFENNNIML